MAVSVPTPLAAPFSGSFSHRPSLRQTSMQQSSHLRVKRSSPTPPAPVSKEGYASTSRPYSVGDSSDDELPAPMKFSALTKALLNEEPSVVEASLPSSLDNGNGSASGQENGHSMMIRSQSFLGDAPLEHGNSPSPLPRRVVRLSGSSAGSATLRRRTSTTTSGSPPARETSPQDLITPAPRPRSFQARGIASHSSGEALAKSDNPGYQTREPVDYVQALPHTLGKPQLSESQESALRFGTSIVGRSKYGEDHASQGSLRIKRVGKVTGSFLSGPARRARRRHSEEDPSPGAGNDNIADAEGGREDHGGPQEAALRDNENPSAGEDIPEHGDVPVPADDVHRVRFATGSPVSGDGHNRAVQSASPGAQGSILANSSSTSSKSSASNFRPVFKVPPPPPSLPSMYDQENEPPPTFKKNKPSSLALQSKFEKPAALSEQRGLGQTPAHASAERRALAPRNQNTPRRPAPPPPKMSVLETATATAGAATTRKKRSHVSVNGKLFTRLDCIGRGGSSRVYRVMAENYKVFALKKVALEDVDEVTIRGYKGEIDLLRKLDQVDRVVKLFDWEVNDEKQSLAVLMEFGESDLNRVLTVRLNAENAKFDISFARYYWKEMLECVQSVHDYGIVHSDLKPANFLLVQGRLKLIDFGIASAIEDDTINIHREQLVGTPNYISPEAIVDTNAKNGSVTATGKMMKLGKPSDVWSLGCILYQMAYGKPPFAHISNPMQRIMAIPNPNHAIDFPATGMGGVPVPVGLLRTLRGCLTRDQLKRPTIQQLLDDRDPFLHPDAERDDMVQLSQEMLGRVLANVVHHCQAVGIPSEADLASWPAGFFTRIKKALREEV